MATLNVSLNIAANEIHQVADQRNRYAIGLQRCDSLAEFAITAIEQDDPDSTADLLSDIREVVQDVFQWGSISFWDGWKKDWASDYTHIFLHHPPHNLKNTQIHISKFYDFKI